MDSHGRPIAVLKKGMLWMVMWWPLEGPEGYHHVQWPEMEEGHMIFLSYHVLNVMKHLSDDARASACLNRLHLS